MAKKKKQTRSRKKTEEVTERSAFWPLAGAVLMMVLAVFLLLGGFGTGGALPKSLFHGAYWTLGWAAYLTPVALIFFRHIALRQFIFYQRYAFGSFQGGTMHDMRRVDADIHDDDTASSNAVASHFTHARRSWRQQIEASVKVVSPTSMPSSRCACS